MDSKLNSVGAISTGKRVRVFIYLFSIVFLLSSFLPTLSMGETNEPVVYLVQLEDTVEKGLHAFLARALNEAEAAGADHFIVEMNTYGGAVDAADQIGQLFRNANIPITVYVNRNAISAGAYIALNADNIIMTPTATIGSAAVVDLEGNTGDAKATSMWMEAMASAAESNGRDPEHAKAMVDPANPLTFGASAALENGYAEAIVNDFQEVLEFLNLEGATIQEVEITTAENIARFITNPVVASILLSLASLGLILELYSPGFGVPGAIGLTSLFLFFFGHMIAGFAGWESLILIVVGIGLIIFEVLTPSFGIFGILGIAGVITSLTMASVDVVAGLRSIGIAIAVSIIVILFLGRSMNKRGLWSKLVLQEDLSSEEGNLRNETRMSLIGQEGIALTRLRPSGTALINNQRVDVVTEGGFIEREQTVRVVFTEGTRIVVRGVSNNNNE